MAKHAFEGSADQRGTKILHYHADNGRFTETTIITDCKAQQQGLSYCGVNAHFQNRIAERCIYDLQEQTRTSMLYAMNKWKQMILISHNLLDMLGVFWTYHWTHVRQFTGVQHHKKPQSVPDST